MQRNAEVDLEKRHDICTRDRHAVHRLLPLSLVIVQASMSACRLFAEQGVQSSWSCGGSEFFGFGLYKKVGI